jgi:hypothetical protein
MQPLVRSLALGLVFLAAAPVLLTAADPEAEMITTPRRPESEDELRYWLGNMLGDHHFSDEEAAAATGLAPNEVRAAATRFGIVRGRPTPPRPGAEALLRVLPYPGGRHPRIGFLDGAVDPQRETKISVFTPWDPASYVVADIPEAIWSNLGLTYLAHTHVPTIFSAQEITLKPQEWQRNPDGTLEMERGLPNGIRFGTRVAPGADAVRMEMWLMNGTREPLRDLRVQNCVMLKGASGFTSQTNDNKVLQPPYAAARSDSGDRWILTRWEPIHRSWGNPPCPCIHADPKFPDCAPGETVRLRGWLSFHEGRDIEAQLGQEPAGGVQSPR